MTYGCRREVQAETAAKYSRLVAVLGIPARIGRCRDGYGITITWTVRGRGRDADRQRTAAHMALMDAERVLGLHGSNGDASRCQRCGCSCFDYDHTAAFCEGVLELAAEWGITPKIVQAICPDCGAAFTPPAPGGRHFPGLCDGCYAKLCRPELEEDCEDCASCDEPGADCQAG